LINLYVDISILAIAFIIDIVFCEPPPKIHPVVWIGKVIGFLDRYCHCGKPLIEKFRGCLMALLSIFLASIATLVILEFSRYFLGIYGYVLVSALILKTMFGFRSMREHVVPIIDACKLGDMKRAREMLSKVVRRDVWKLDDNQVISAAIETIAEGTVDGVTSTLFYYGLFGVIGAVVQRVVNTLDSIVGYKDEYYRNVGWFSAKLDTIFNFVPARVTALIIALSALVLGKNYRDSFRIALHDHKRTESINAGWPMAAMAGALDVQLEKPGHYKLGIPRRKLTPELIYNALHIMYLSTILFIMLIVIPTLIICNAIFEYFFRCLI